MVVVLYERRCHSILDGAASSNGTRSRGRLVGSLGAFLCVEAGLRVKMAFDFGRGSEQ